MLKYALSLKPHPIPEWPDTPCWPRDLPCRPGMECPLPGPLPWDGRGLTDLIELMGPLAGSLF